MDELEREIGEAAGKIWSALNTNGPMSRSRLSKVTGLPANSIAQGIGWLAREGKLSRDKGNKGELIKLRN